MPVLKWLVSFDTTEGKKEGTCLLTASGAQLSLPEPHAPAGVGNGLQCRCTWALTCTSYTTGHSIIGAAGESEHPSGVQGHTVREKGKNSKGQINTAAILAQLYDCQTNRGKSAYVMSLDVHIISLWKTFLCFILAIEFINFHSMGGPAV